MVTGDDGLLTFAGGLLAKVQTLDPAAGGNDAITVGGDDNIVINGAGGDRITLGNGGNVVIGDNGFVSFASPGLLATVEALDPVTGDDRIITGLGHDLVIGGAGSDVINAGAGTDKINAGSGANIVLQGAIDQRVANSQLPVWQIAAAPAPASAAEVAPLNAGQLQSVVAEAKLLWTDALGAGNTRLAALSGVTVERGDLPAGILGATLGDVIIVDPTAAGWGWFVDPTPADNSEFADVVSAGVLFAEPDSPAAGHMDLLSTVLHELGNAMGFPEDHGEDVTGLVLQAGERRLPVGIPVFTAPTFAGATPVVAPVVAPVVDWGIMLNGAASRQAFAPSPETPSWVSDFTNHLDQDAARHSPNAGIRVHVPAAGLIS